MCVIHASFLIFMTDCLLIELPAILQFLDDIARQEFVRANQLQIQIASIYCDDKTSNKEKLNSMCSAIGQNNTLNDGLAISALTLPDVNCCSASSSSSSFS